MPSTAISPSDGSRSIAGRKRDRTRAACTDTPLDVVGLGAQLVGLHLLGTEALDHPHPGDRLLDDRGELRLLGLHRQHRRMDRRSRTSSP